MINDEKEALLRSRAQKYVRKFTAITLNEFENLQENKMNITHLLTMDVAHVENLDEEELRKMTYDELITMIELTKDNVYYHNIYYYDDVNAVQNNICTYFLYHTFCRMLIRSVNASITVNLFLSLPLRVFFKYLQSVTPNHEAIDRLYNEILKSYMEAHKAKADLTLMEILQTVYSEISKPWTMAEPVEKYQEHIFNELSIIRKVFAVSFITATPWIYDEESLLEKYRIWDDE